MTDTAQPQADNVLENAREAISRQDTTLALQYYLQAAELEPENVEIINQVARCYYTLGEFDRALACWNLALANNPADAAAEKAIAEFYDLPFQFWLKRYREAVAELEGRNYQKACDMLSDLVSEQDGFVSLYQLLGLCYFAESDMETARRVWSRGLTLDIANPILLKYLAMRRDEAGIIKTEAASNQDRAWPVKTAGWALVACLGIFLLAQMGLGFYQHNVVSMHYNAPKKAGSLMSKHTGVSGVNTVASSRDKLSAGVPEDSSQGDPGEEERELEYYRRGYSAYRQGDWKTACSNLDMVVSMNTKDYINREALYYLAQSYYFRRDYNQARANFEKYLAEYPKSDYNDDSLYYLGCTALEQKDLATARQAFSRLGQVDPASGYFSTAEYRRVIESN